MSFNPKALSEDFALVRNPLDAIGQTEGVSLVGDTSASGFGELYNEIGLLTDEFINSLSAKIHPAPFSASQLSKLFQDFYAIVSASISTHIAQIYDTPPSGHLVKEQRMLPLGQPLLDEPDRSLGEEKRLMLEEAVEKKVTEAVYTKIWRHKTTDDEARDQTLGSKISALNLVGVRASHLGIGVGVSDEALVEALAEPRQALLQMSKEMNPLAKVNVLRGIHQSIVAVLASFYTSSNSSADQILPTLIFTVLHSQSQISIISDLFFIRRFRSREKMDGEVEYCLTNLEAAFTFLETVDLATLHLEDTPNPPSSTILRKTDSDLVGTTYLSETSPDSQLTNVVHHTSSCAISSVTSNPRNRPFVRIEPIGSTGTTAGVSISSLGSTLELCYKIISNRIQSRHNPQIPKTLEEARLVVSRTAPTPNDLSVSLFEDSSSSLHSLKLNSPPAVASNSQFSLQPRSSSLSHPSHHAPSQKGLPSIRPSFGTNGAQQAANGASHAASVAAPAAAAVIEAVGSGLRGIAAIGLRGLHGAASYATISSDVTNEIGMEEETSTAEKGENERRLIGPDENVGKLHPSIRVEPGPGDKGDKAAQRELTLPLPVIKRKFLFKELTELTIGEVDELLCSYKDVVRWLDAEMKCF